MRIFVSRCNFKTPEQLYSTGRANSSCDLTSECQNVRRVNDAILVHHFGDIRRVFPLKLDHTATEVPWFWENHIYQFLKGLGAGVY